MNSRIPRHLLVPIAVAIAAFTAGFAWLDTWMTRANAHPQDHASPDAAALWSCPMHPDYTSAHPGTCPICGMQLVRTSAGHVVHHAQQVHVPAEAQQRLGVVVRPAEVLAFEPSFAVSAQLVSDERRSVSLAPKVEGWIRQLGVSVVGQSVGKGQMLYEIYSPELQQRERDYIDLLGRRDALLAQSGGMAVGSTSPDLMMASVARERFLQRSRLAAADVPEAVIVELENTRRVREVVPVLAQHDGVITSIGAREGAFVTPSQPVVAYADLTAVWAELSLTADQLALLQPHARVALRIPSQPEPLDAPVGATQALVDPVTHLARIRVPLRAAGRQLRAGTIVDAEVHLPARKALMVPRDAVIRTGHADLVIVSDGADHFRQAQVELGAETRDQVEVRRGLVQGESVVVNGQFLIGAEASLNASRLNLAGAAGSQ